MLNSLFKSIFFKTVMNSLNALIPKDKELSIFNSFPDVDDNIKILLRCTSGRKVVILNDKNYINQGKINEEEYYYKYSLMGCYYLFRASKIYFTHNIYRGFRCLNERRQLVINMWHGMPLKRIGMLDNKPAPASSHYILSTSIFYQQIMADAFDVSRKRVVIAGLPRNQVLIEPPSKKLIEQFGNYDALLIWLPTYRRSNVGDIRQDGDVNYFDEESISDLNLTLFENNKYLIIKKHPMDNDDYISFKGYSNILVVNEKWLVQENYSLYELLAFSSALISDYSSVIIDYLVTDKPIYYYTPDKEQYINSRGLIDGVSLDSAPGESLKDFESFMLLVKEKEYQVNYDLIQSEKFNSVKGFNLKQLTDTIDNND